MKKNVIGKIKFASNTYKGQYTETLIKMYNFRHMTDTRQILLKNWLEQKGNMVIIYRI